MLLIQTTFQIKYQIYTYNTSVKKGDILPRYRHSEYHFWDTFDDKSIFMRQRMIKRGKSSILAIVLRVSAL